MSDEVRNGFLQTLAASHEADRMAGRAHFGGMFSSTWYREGYLRAARAVFDDAQAHGLVDQMAAVVVFLLRHTIEITLKNIIDAVRDIEAMKHALDTGEYLEPKWAHGHELDELLRDASAALATQKETMPPEFAALVSEIWSFEDKDPTRTRYSRGLKARYRKQSFPTRVVAPVQDWLTRLEQVHSLHFELRRGFDLLPNTEWRICEVLALEGDALSQNMYDRFG